MSILKNSILLKVIACLMICIFAFCIVSEPIVRCRAEVISGTLIALVCIAGVLATMGIVVSLTDGYNSISSFGDEFQDFLDYKYDHNVVLGSLLSEFGISVFNGYLSFHPFLYQLCQEFTEWWAELNGSSVENPAFVELSNDYITLNGSLVQLPVINSSQNLKSIFTKSFSNPINIDYTSSQFSQTLFTFADIKVAMKGPHSSGMTIQFSKGNNSFSDYYLFSSGPPNFVLDTIYFVYSVNFYYLVENDVKVPYMAIFGSQFSSSIWYDTFYTPININDLSSSMGIEIFPAANSSIAQSPSLPTTTLPSSASTGYVGSPSTAGSRSATVGDITEGIMSQLTTADITQIADPTIALTPDPPEPESFRDIGINDGRRLINNVNEGLDDFREGLDNDIDNLLDNLDDFGDMVADVFDILPALVQYLITFSLAFLVLRKVVGR